MDVAKLAHVPATRVLDHRNSSVPRKIAAAVEKQWASLTDTVGEVLAAAADFPSVPVPLTVSKHQSDFREATGMADEESCHAHTAITQAVYLVLATRGREVEVRFAPRGD